MSSKTTPDFTFTPEQLKSNLALWHREGWPVKLLSKDHYGAKLLQDNEIFNLMRFFKHEVKWDEEDELLILHKKTRKSNPMLCKWSEIYPHLPVKKTARGEFIFDGATYGADGIEFEKSFQFSPAEFKWMLNKWVKEEWPVPFLLRDHYGAKVLFDNQVFQYIEFYGHEYKWDEEKGLILMCKRADKTEWVAWNDIVDDIPIQKSPQGWLLMDGWIYGQEGLMQEHLWEWKELPTSYVFPPNTRKPDVCYVDIVTFNWEHEGLPGLGFSSTPHGHTSIEFGNDLGEFWSVGMYMDPRSTIDTKKSPAATVRACLMTPDPYLPSYGEKAIHRYHVGTGKEGRDNIAKLKKHLERIQDWKKNEETGIVKVCPRKYHTFKYNCGDFQEEIEKFAQEQLNGKLIKIDDSAVFVPLRTRVHKSSNLISDTFTTLWNKALLLLVDIIIWIAITIPWLAKLLGSTKQDDFSDFDKPNITTHGQVKKKWFGLTLFAANNFDSMKKSLRPQQTKFPRRRRLDQLYSPKLRRYSALLKS